MGTIYVLIMLWYTGVQQGGITTVQQEFNSFESCEAARLFLAKQTAYNVSLHAQGCFKK